MRFISCLPAECRGNRQPTNEASHLQSSNLQSFDHKISDEIIFVIVLRKSKYKISHLLHWCNLSMSSLQYGRDGGVEGDGDQLRRHGRHHIRPSSQLPAGLYRMILSKPSTAPINVYDNSNLHGT